MLAIVVAVLSLGGQGIASRVAAASATAAIAASSAEWRATGAALERAGDVWSAPGEQGVAPALLPVQPSWELDPAALAHVLVFAPMSTGTPVEPPVGPHVARGPPAVV